MLLRGERSTKVPWHYSPVHHVLPCSARGPYRMSFHTPLLSSPLSLSPHPSRSHFSRQTAFSLRYFTWVSIASPHDDRAQLQAAPGLSGSGSLTSPSRRQCIRPCLILPAAHRLNASPLDESIARCSQNAGGRCSTSMGFVYKISCCEWRVVGYLDEL